MGARKWTKEEEDLLREVWFQRGSLKVHAKRFVGRNSNALHRHGRSTLGLPLRMDLATDRYSIVREQVAEAFENGFIGTVQDLVVEIGQCEREVLRRVREGHGTKYHISDWVRSKAFSDWTAIYSLGAKPDAPKPATQTNQEKRKRHNNKRKVKSGKFNPFAGLISQPPTVEKNSSELGRRGAYTVRRYSLEA